MLRIIVAEDEYFARKALVKLLKETGLPIGEVREAETGVEALALLKQEAADIVITDIRMPDMDGLELAERLSREREEIKVIIESGYSDFNYAKSAIKYGVKDYLTKPVSREELSAAIRKIMEEQQKDRQKIDRELTENRLRYMDFSYLLEKEEIGVQLLGKAAEEFGEGSWRLCVAQNECPPLTDGQVKRILDLFEKPAGNRRAAAYYFGVKEEFIVIYGGEVENSSLMETVVKGALELCGKEGDARLKAGMSESRRTSGDFLKNLAGAYREAVYALNQRLLGTGGPVYTYVNEMNVARLFGAENEKLLEQYLLEHKTGRAAGIVEEFLEHCRESRDITIYSLFTSVIQIMNVIHRVYGMRRQQDERDREGVENGAYLMFSFKADLYSFHSMEELKAYIVSLIEDAGAEGEPEPTIIDGLLDYLERNYQYDISLNELAAHKYFVSPSYLSRLFKAKTGKNFTRYLMELRMEKARMLLQKTGLKVSDVAAYTGYNDVSYFIQAFKKHNGMTPEHFRDMET